MAAVTKWFFGGRAATAEPDGFSLCERPERVALRIGNFNAALKQVRAVL